MFIMLIFRASGPALEVRADLTFKIEIEYPKLDTRDITGIRLLVLGDFPGQEGGLPFC